MEKQTFTSYNSHFFTARQAQTSESFHLGQSLKVKMLATRHVTHRLYTCHHHLSFICFLKVSQFTFYDNDPAPSTWKTNDRTQTHWKFFRQFLEHGKVSTVKRFPPLESLDTCILQATAERKDSDSPLSLRDSVCKEGLENFLFFSHL